jgi:hypothetical protein
MANLLEQAGAAGEPTNFAPLHTNRIFTGLWTNRSLLRDAATSAYQERFGMGRQDSILDGVNSEISQRLTLRRRRGSSVYNANAIPPVKRFYSFNTFTLTDESIRVMADTAAAVYDYTAPDLTLIFQKSPAAVGNKNGTFFLGVGNTLYFTNGVDNKQWLYGPNQVFDWGIIAPTTAPVATQVPRPNPYPNWGPNEAYAAHVQTNNGGFAFNGLVIVGSDNNIQKTTNNNTELGLAEPPWNPPGSTTLDGSTNWFNLGPPAWKTSYGYGLGELCIGYPEPAGTAPQLFVSISSGTSNATGIPPIWPAQIGRQISDGTSGLIWQNIGRALQWSDVGINGQYVTVRNSQYLVDPNGNLQAVYQMGRTGATPPNIWASEKSALTADNTIIWQNAGPYSVPGTAPVLYGYAFKNSVTKDISNMSPRSNPITVIQGNEVTVQGDGSTQNGVDTVILYRTAAGGSTFLYLAEFPNPSPGVKWSYVDTTPDSGLNPTIQAQVAGEGTPLPPGATCLGYHLGRIFAAVGNVVYVSSGPDAIASTSSGNSGFNTTFTAQSKITRFWTCSLGLVVFTVRDAYIILGSATANDPLYMVVFIEQLPLLSYDAFTVNKTTPMLMQGNNIVIALDPSAGIVEIGYPIADKLYEEYDPSTAYVTFHSESSAETALYVANGVDHWYRMNSNNAPEQGSAWSTRADIAQMGCVQSVEVTPGKFRLLIGSTVAGPVLQRDRNARTDNGTSYPVRTVFGNIVLAQPGQLAALSFITLESERAGTRAGLALLLGEIRATPNNPFDKLDRTRQDPTNLPPSETLYSDRYHFEQNQKTAWCRHFQMEVTWPAEDADNELLTFTIFGQTWQEARLQ